MTVRGLGRIARLGGQLAAATVFGQLVYLACLPLIARLFATEVVGSYAAIQAICVIAGGLAGLRLDYVIGVSRSRQTISLAIALAALTSAVGGVCAVFAVFLFDAAPYRGVLAGLVFATAMAQGMSPALVAASLAEERNRLAIILVVARAGIVGPIQLAVGTKFTTVEALIAGNAVYVTVTLVASSAFLRRRGLEVRRQWLGTVALWRRHKTQITYGTLQAMTGILGQNVPLMMVKTISGAESAGLFWMALKLIQAPTAILAESIRQPLLQTFRRQVVLERKALWTRATSVLAGAGMCIAAIFGLLSSQAVEVMLGAQWSNSSELVSILAIWAVFLVANVPSTTVLVIFAQQRYLFGIETTLVVVRLVLLGVALLVGSLLLGVSVFVAVSVVGNIYIMIAARRQLLRECYLR